jgi:hypothetical protein
MNLSREAADHFIRRKRRNRASLHVAQVSNLLYRSASSLRALGLGIRAERLHGLPIGRLGQISRDKREHPV